MIWQKIWYPIYDHCSGHSCHKHSLWRAFVDGLLDYDVKVAFSKKTSPAECIGHGSLNSFASWNIQIGKGLFDVSKRRWKQTSSNRIEKLTW